MKTAVFPGSFDPITVGHYDVILRAAEIFDRVIVAVMNNCDKRYMFDLDKRFEMVRASFDGIPGIEAVKSDGLLAQLALDNDAAIVKGIRNASDFTYEYELFEINKAINGRETVFLPAAKEHIFISSTFVRELISYGRDFSAFVPAPVYKYLKKS